MKKRHIWCCLVLIFTSLPELTWSGVSVDTSASSAAAATLTTKLAQAEALLTGKSNATVEQDQVSRKIKGPVSSSAPPVTEQASVHPQSGAPLEQVEAVVPDISPGTRVEELHSSFEEVGVKPEEVKEAVGSSSSLPTHQEPPSSSQTSPESASSISQIIKSESSVLDTVAPTHNVPPAPVTLETLKSQNASVISESGTENSNITKKESKASKKNGEKPKVTEAPKDVEVKDPPKIVEPASPSPPAPIPKELDSTSEATLPPALTPKEQPTSTPSMGATKTESTRQAQAPSARNHSEDSAQGEDIPSFSEWTQKRLAEAEKRKGQNASELPKAAPKSSGNLKLSRSKNYASPDCGAKIAASNSEAISPSSVLSSSRDEYILSPCTSSKIWFVVELCDSIQAKQVELANFELFSSSPKEFSVSVSDRFPSRDWRAVGHFTAQDERVIQSFTLEPHLFGKFIKVEFHSHYGSEHYCPVSLFRAYGTSEFEVLDTDEAGHGSDEPQHGEEEEVEELGVVSGDPPKNLFGSAKDAVMSIVKKAAQVLVKTGDSKNSTETDPIIEDNDSCSFTPRPGLELCVDCSPNVLRLLTCHKEVLQSMLLSRYVIHSLQKEQLCLGKQHNDSYLAALLPAEYITALCHLLLALHKPHSTAESQNYENLTLETAHYDPYLLLHPSESAEMTTTCSQEDPALASSVPTEDSVTQASVIHPGSSSAAESSDGTGHIRPTRTLKDGDTSEGVSESAPVIATALPDHPLTVAQENTTSEVNPEEETEGVPEEWNGGETLDTLLAELKDDEAVQPPPPQLPPQQPSQPPPIASSATNMPAHQQGQQKESVFVRLANRIKALERNMSLSAQYLEELSRRYKKQVEEMQRAFDRTLAAVQESTQKAVQREQQQAEQLSALEQRLGALAATTAALLSERDSWQYKAGIVSQHIFMLIVGLLLLGYMIRQCLPSHPTRESSPEAVPIVVAPLQRRRSMEDSLHPLSAQRKRRPSEETSCERKMLSIKADNDIRMDPSRRKRRKLRRDLRGVSVEELCSGLSPATLAVVRQPFSKPKPPLPPSRAMLLPKSRRHSTDNLVMRNWDGPAMTTQPEHQPEQVLLVNGGNSDRESSCEAPPVKTLTIESSPSPPQPRKGGGLRKMVRKLF